MKRSDCDTKPIPLEEILIENSSYNDGRRIKKKLLDSKFNER